MTRVAEVVPGLRRWTALHEEWREEVASLALDTEDGLVLIDPIDPPRGLARPDHVLLTVFWHDRSAADLGAPHVWASSRAARRKSSTISTSSVGWPRPTSRSSSPGWPALAQVA